MCAVGGAQNLKNFSKCLNLDEYLYDFGIHLYVAPMLVVNSITYCPTINAYLMWTWSLIAFGPGAPSHLGQGPNLNWALGLISIGPWA